MVMPDGAGSPRQTLLRERQLYPARRRTRRHDRGVLAEVVPLWPAPPSRDGGARGLKAKITQVVASLRAQATPEGIPPMPPPPPAPLARLPHSFAAAPDDAA